MRKNKFPCQRKLLRVFFKKDSGIPVGIQLLKVNKRNTRTRCEIYSKLTIKTPERRHWRHADWYEKAMAIAYVMCWRVWYDL